PLISVDALRFFVSSSATLNAYNTTTNQLNGLTAVWDLDRPTDNYIKLDATLGSGSGSSDMFAFIPDYAFAGASATSTVYVYSNSGTVFANTSGFEEWDFQRLSTPIAPPPLATISGFVYNDANNDGIKGATEAGISGVTVRLTGTNDLNAAVSLTTTTNASGA